MLDKRRYKKCPTRAINLYASRYYELFQTYARRLSRRLALGCRSARALAERAGTLRHARSSLRGGPAAEGTQQFYHLPEDAEEAVQDAFTKMYLYADRYRPQEGASFSSWAYTILNRVAYTKYRAKKIERDERAELSPEQYESLPDARAEFLEDLSVRNEVLAALAKLPETAAKILRLQFIEGKNQEEIAASEQLSIPAVKTRVHRAKKLFKKIYDEQHYE